MKSPLEEFFQGDAAQERPHILQQLNRGLLRAEEYYQCYQQDSERPVRPPEPVLPPSAVDHGQHFITGDEELCLIFRAQGADRPLFLQRCPKNFQDIYDEWLAANRPRIKAVVTGSNPNASWGR